MTAVAKTLSGRAEMSAPISPAMSDAADSTSSSAAAIVGLAPSFRRKTEAGFGMPAKRPYSAGAIMPVSGRVSALLRAQPGAGPAGLLRVLKLLGDR